MYLLHRLRRVFHEALRGLVDDPASYSLLVKPVQDPKHGDYQANCAMSLGKRLGKPPRDVAADLVARLDVGDFLETPEIAGPGFINLRIRADWLAQQLRIVARDPRIGVLLAQAPKTLIVDFSSPNVAKPMHVGHLRSSIIGDCLARLHCFLGHRVITDNHLGDWGTQFGILLYGYKHFRDDAALAADPVREMARLYVHVRTLMKGDEDDEAVTNPVAAAARLETAKLHAGDEENVRLWKLFMPWCLEEIDHAYRRLDVHFDHTHGESFYNPMLPAVVADMQAKGMARETRGAVGIFFGDEEQPPALIRKSDGAFTYTTTDLATIRYRMETWHPDAIFYVVDARQALHFKNLFDAAFRWGYDQVQLEHVSFGSVCGPDRKPIKTRDGVAVELMTLLDEAVERAAGVYETTIAELKERGKEVVDLSAAEKAQIAEIVGIGAVKYADLSQNRTSDYLFSWDKMLAMDGNTATYMQYAYARMRGIFREGNENSEDFRQEPPLPTLGHPSERALALQLLRFGEILEDAAAELKPNLITSYLWDLAKAFSGFYQNCTVLKAENAALRRSRLLLCDLTGRTIQRGLDLLGIRTLERM